MHQRDSKPYFSPGKQKTKKAQTRIFLHYTRLT